ncbi:MAG: SDR family NAD(P)-dependent oxidoreductase, partial [Acetobacteraceae bacterium]|nr:SDR family NAD(P)-dependent oxidoreductase [Acetobacteraceae bacterium]
ADSISYVECHGTGTVVGDPLEIEALSRAFRASTQRRGFCAVGSVKTNIGHLEQAAGVASLIKAALALHHNFIPPSLNFRRANPKIDFAASPFFVEETGSAWTDGSQPRRAAVNGLGLGGTNAFVVLEAAAPSSTPANEGENAVHIVPFSAPSPETLRLLLSRQEKALDDRAEKVADIASTFALGRKHFTARRGLVGANIDELRRGLQRESGPAALPEGERRLFFAFTGQGSQYAGMAAGLYRRERIFRDVVDRCSDLLRAKLPLALTDVMFGDDGTALERTEYTQPSLFAIQAALSALWRSWGIAPDGVLGHSIGEFAASVVAGSLNLEDALHLVAARGKLMGALPAGGGMTAIMAEPDAVADLMHGIARDDLAIAALNGPAATVVSGRQDALDAVTASAARRGWRTQTLPVSHAFHSPLMRDAAEALVQAAPPSSATRNPALSFVSTVSGSLLTEPPEAAYWRAHALVPVRFMDAVRAALALGATHFIEIGPGTMLQALGRLSDAEGNSVWLGSLDRKDGDERRMLTTLARLWESGWEPDWKAVLSSRPGRRISLPTTPFDSKRHWLERGGEVAGGLDWRRIPAASRDVLFEMRLGLSRQTFLGDHRIYGVPVLPTTFGLTALARAAREHFRNGNVELRNLQYGKALVLPESGDVTVQCVLTPIDASTAEIRLASSQGVDGAFATHMTAFAERVDEEPIRPAPINRIRERCRDPVTRGRFYSAADALGLNYGPAFRGIVSLERRESELVTRVELPREAGTLDGAPLHPALLDACLHAYPALVADYGDLSGVSIDPRGTFLPVGVERFRISGEPAKAAWLHAQRRSAGDGGELLTTDLTIYGEDGTWLGSIEGLMLKRLPSAAIGAADGARAADCLYRLRWENAAPAEPSTESDREAGAEGWLILADRSGVGSALARCLQERGFVCRTVFSDDPDLAMADTGDREADPQPEAFATLLAEASHRAQFTLRGVVDLWPLDMPEPGQHASEIEQTQRAGLGSAIDLINAISASRDRGGAAPQLWLVTRMAVAAQVGDEVPGVAQASLWGLGRTAAVECPAIWGGLIDLGPGDPQAAAGFLLAEVLGGGEEDQVALRGDTRRVPRLVRLAPSAPALSAFDRNAAYLITGGSGFIGRELASWLVATRGVRHIYLASRKGADDPASQHVAAALERLGAVPVLLKADVADAASVDRLIADVTAGAAPLRGVFHCAGMLDDALLANLKWSAVARVLAAKLTGAWFLHAATRSLGLDHFVLFSSVLSLTGSAGQANYTAANAFLDALAAKRRAEGLAALTLNWGPWDEAGIATQSGEKGRAIWRARGTQYIPAETGRRIFGQLIGSSLDGAAITFTDWPVFLRQFPKAPPLYAELRGECAEMSTPRVAEGTRSILAQLRGSSGPQRRPLLVELIAAEAQQTLGAAEPIEGKKPLREYGLDSLMSLNLLHRLEASLQRRIPASVMIAGPSAETLARALDPDPEDPAVTQVLSVGSNDTAGQWLVTVAPRLQPRLRLFCFPFAGGGSAIFRSWGDTIGAAIEVIAVEPPGRLGRVGEPPVNDMAAFVAGVTGEIQHYLDRPFAFYGHCLGGLTLWEVARDLRRRGAPLPLHMFVSGARSPDHTGDEGAFEERLMSDLTGQTGFRLDVPPFQQPDDVFAEIIRRFNIAASEQMLADREFRDLMLPTIRAEFQMASNYRFTPEPAGDIPITCFAAKGDPYVTRRQALDWGRFTNQRFQLFVREGAHFAIADDKAFIHEVINRELADA